MLDYYAEDIGISKELFYKLGSLLGSGLNLGSTCGAVTSAYLILGAKYGEDSGAVKGKMKKFNEDFLSLNNSLQCKELLGADITIPSEREKLIQNGTKSKVCPKAVMDSINILKKL